jgi:hypothetical protein
MMTNASARLADALADRYRIERAATHVAARHIIATRFGWSSIIGCRYLPEKEFSL